MLARVSSLLLFFTHDSSRNGKACIHFQCLSWEDKPRHWFIKDQYHEREKEKKSPQETTKLLVRNSIRNQRQR